MSNEFIQPGMFISLTCLIMDSNGKRQLAGEHLTAKASNRKVREVLPGEAESPGMHDLSGLSN